MKKMFIGGQWIAAQDGQTIPVFSPVDGQQFDSISRGRAHEVDLAVKAATRALEGAWGRLNATERGRVMIRIGQKVLENVDELSKLEAKDTGKPISNARNDVTILARYFEFYGGAADKIHGQIIPFLNDHSVSVIREPHGVTGHIIPWNYPAQMLGRTLAPALAMGNAAVLKPAEDTSMSALRFAEIATDAGLPGGALNVVTGLGEEAGAALTAHAGINFLTFTGSNEVGAHVQEAAARNAVKCVLSLEESLRKLSSMMPIWIARCRSSLGPSFKMQDRRVPRAVDCWSSGKYTMSLLDVLRIRFALCALAHPIWTSTVVL